MGLRNGWRLGEVGEPGGTWRFSLRRSDLFSFCYDTLFVSFFLSWGFEGGGVCFFLACFHSVFLQ